jgi:hypothetical protein
VAELAYYALEGVTPKRASERANVGLFCGGLLGQPQWPVSLGPRGLVGCRKDFRPKGRKE